MTQKLRAKVKTAAPSGVLNSILCLANNCNLQQWVIEAKYTIEKHLNQNHPTCKRAQRGEIPKWWFLEVLSLLAFAFGFLSLCLGRALVCYLPHSVTESGLEVPLGLRWVCVGILSNNMRNIDVAEWFIAFSLALLVVKLPLRWLGASVALGFTFSVRLRFCNL